MNRRYKLECWVADGEADGAYGWGDHAWNIVNIDGNYYHVDVTWDDPDESDNINYDYFLISDEQMSTDHKWDINNEYLYQCEFTDESSGFIDMPVCPNNYKN